jgi:hypothetical protein
MRASGNTPACRRWHDRWTFNLMVKTNTPADFYTINSQMAGYYASTMWSQQESLLTPVAAGRRTRPLRTALRNVDSPTPARHATPAIVSPAARSRPHWAAFSGVITAPPRPGRGA